MVTPDHIRINLFSIAENKLISHEPLIPEDFVWGFHHKASMTGCS